VAPSLTAGTRLGVYEVEVLIGAGGMGEVYRARDTRLDRPVAVKTLSSVAADPDRVRRFESEARTAGSLNHPNVLTLYDIGTHEGAPYLVCELLEGATLRDLLRAGGLVPRRVTDYAVQIARGLAAAHARGIVHRDLKPENIFVTRDGRVKILDFGLAKLTLPADEASPTVEMEGVHTATGVVLGTVGYMSPEQVQGRAAGPQSDIFSFGVVLYEMLSGRRAFSADTALDTLNAIVKSDPPELSDATHPVPPALERIVGRCLEKDPAQRFQSAQDLAFALEAVSDRSTRDTPLAPRASRRSRRWIAIAAGVMALAGASAAGVWIGRETARATPATFRQVTFRRGTVFSARFGPDGRTIFYSAAWDGGPMKVFSAPAEGPESTDLLIPNAAVLATSSTGEMLVRLQESLTGFSTIGKLARVPLAGGAPREMMNEVLAADFGPDGRSVAVLRRMDMMVRVEYPIGTTRYEGASTSNTGYLRVSPSGNIIAFSNGSDLRVVRTDGSPPTVVASARSIDCLAWSRDGSEVWFSASQDGLNDDIYAVSPSSGRERLVFAQSASSEVHDIASSGRVLLAAARDRREMAGLFPGEASERDYSLFNWSYPRDFSADGRFVLFTEASGVVSTYLRKTDGSPAVRLGEGASQALSPNGRWAVAIRPDGEQLVVFPTGTGDSRILPKGLVKHVRAPVVWLPDNKRILFMGRERDDVPSRIYLQDVDSGDPRPVSPVDWVLGLAVPSDNLSFTAVTGDEATPVIGQLDGGAPVPIVGLAPGDWPLRWSSDGRVLYVLEAGASGHPLLLPARVFRLDTSTHQRTLWRTFAPSDSAGLRTIGLVLPTPDGRHYVYDYQRTLSELFLVSGLR
jgi:Tol biopolymer transport system component